MGRGYIATAPICGPLLMFSRNVRCWGPTKIQGNVAKKKTELRSFPLGLEPLYPPPSELLSKQTCYGKGVRRLTTCKKKQSVSIQRCRPHHNGPPAFILSFLPSYHFFFVEQFTASLPLGREPLCPPTGELMSKQVCSAKCERCRMTCKAFQHQRRPHCRDVVLTKLVPLASCCHFPLCSFVIFGIVGCRGPPTG